MTGGSQNTVSTQTVPDWLQPYLTSNLQSGNQLLSTGQDSYTSEPVAGLSSLQQQGLNSISGVNPTAIGAADSSLTNTLNGNNFATTQSTYNASNPQLQAVASGQYLNPSTNPYLQSSYNLGLQGIQNNVDSQFGAAGRNVLAGAPVQADQASTLANSIYGGAYQNNMENMLAAQNQVGTNYNAGQTAMNQAAAYSPSVTEGMYVPGSSQLSAGSTQQQQTQNELNAPYNTLSWYSSLLNQNANPFGSSSSSTSNGSGSLASELSTGIGAAAGMASLYSALAGMAAS